MREKVRKERTNQILSQIINSVILAGIIVLFIGLYYWMIEAGIPYQDPTPELQIKYAVNTEIGEVLIGKGFAIAVCGGVIRLIYGLILRKNLSNTL